MPKPTAKKTAAPEAPEPDSLQAHLIRFGEWQRVRNLSNVTIDGRHKRLRIFLEWAQVRSITQPHQVTRKLLEAYQRHLYHRRQRNGRPLSPKTQAGHLTALRAFFKWLVRDNVLQTNPAAELELPRLGRPLPTIGFTLEEVERIFDQPDLSDVIGLRDRAILEVLYSTGIRRTELIGLGTHDLDVDRGVLRIRHGKGNRDRYVAIGNRAVDWVSRYRVDARPELVVAPDDGTLFLSNLGGPFSNNHLSALVRGYIEAAGIDKKGACHLFRHTLATHMLENDVDVRLVQEQLGHAELSTTAIYTRVSIKALKAAHERCHERSRE